MNIQATSQLSSFLTPPSVRASTDEGVSAPPAELQQSIQTADDEKVREAFTQFVGETFFGQLIKSMRSSLGKPAYFHGGRAEEVFQGQLDQMLNERFAESSADHIAEPMYELFRLNRHR